MPFVRWRKTKTRTFITNKCSWDFGLWIYPWSQTLTHEYICSTTFLCALQFTHDRSPAFGQTCGEPYGLRLQVHQRCKHLATSVCNSLTKDLSWYLNRWNWSSLILRSEFMDTHFVKKVTRGGKIHKHCPGRGQARGGSKPKLSPRSSYYRWRYSHMNTLKTPLICAYCISPMIVHELFAWHACCPTDQRCNHLATSVGKSLT